MCDLILLFLEEKSWHNSIVKDSIFVLSFSYMLIFYFLMYIFYEGYNLFYIAGCWGVAIWFVLLNSVADYIWITSGIVLVLKLVYVLLATRFTWVVRRACKSYWRHSHRWSPHKWRCRTCHWNCEFLGA